MTVDFGDWSDERLVSRFIEIGEAQDSALRADQVARFRRLYREYAAIVQELRRRPGDKRRLLLALLGNGNMQVRVNAAKSTLGVDRAAARSELEAIHASRWEPQAFDAGMAVALMDEGIFKPK